MFFNSIYPGQWNTHRALTQTIVDRATEADAAVLKGLVDRVSKRLMMVLTGNQPRVVV